MHIRGTRVFVGLSGGVDSAVSAALLKDAGASVFGVFIQGWYPPDLPCTWREDRRDAMRVAAKLRIPFATLDASAEYKKSVIDYLLREYGAGRTPNPDVMCNRDVKFGAFFAYARARGADYIATGHYARIVREAHAEISKSDFYISCQSRTRRVRHAVSDFGGAVRLLRGADPTKDQSYFLWAAPESALARTLFPLGEKKKSDVRKIARRYALPVAEKRDSQGICFLGSVSVEEFLRAQFGTTQGRVRDESDVCIGTHDGVSLHTIGARLAIADAPAGPWYVVAKRIKENELIVSRNKTAPNTTATRAITLGETNRARAKSGVFAQYRYHGPLVAGDFALTGARTAEFTARTPLFEPVALGQSLVVYDKDEVIGGGVIEAIRGDA